MLGLFVGSISPQPCADGTKSFHERLLGNPFLRESLGMERWRVTTWNLQGSHGLDIDFVREFVRREQPDIVAVQEVTRRQARRLEPALGMRHVWARKHTPLPGCSEGMAIFTPHVIASWSSSVLTSASPWSWKRRIVIRAQILRGADGFGVLNVHLSPHDAGQRRSKELEKVSSLISHHGNNGLDVLAGDFNDDVGQAIAMLDPALRASDADSSGPATCWPPGRRLGRLPTRRMDGVILLGTGEATSSISASTPTTELDRWSKVSDHLPVTVDVVRRGAVATRVT